MDETVFVWKLFFEKQQKISGKYFFYVGVPPGCSFYLCIHVHTYYVLLDFFLPLEIMFKTHHLLALPKEPVIEIYEKQPLPRKVIWRFSPKMLRYLKVLFKRTIWKVKIYPPQVGFELWTTVSKPVWSLLRPQRHPLPIGNVRKI